MGKGLGDFIGEFLEYDAHNSANFWRQYMRIRVFIEVRQPLRRTKKIKRQGGDARVVGFKYERLDVFCYLCGMLGHMESCCEKLFTMEIMMDIVVGDRTLGWSRGGVEVSRWLREEGREWKGPIGQINAGDRFGGNRGNLNGNQIQREKGNE